MALPAWLAWTVHVPVVRKVIVAVLMAPEVHTKGVVVVKVTVSPDEAVARTVTGDCARVLLASVPKMIVWLALDTVKLWLTGVAAL